MNDFEERKKLKASSRQRQPCWVRDLTLLQQRWSACFLTLSLLFLVNSLLLLSPLPCSSAEPPPPAYLHWKNGDSLKGRILPGNGKRIRWKAPWFSNSFVIRSDYLARINFPEPPKSDPDKYTPHYRFSLRNGDKIFADLVAIDRENVTLSSPGFTDPVVIPRSGLERIENIDGKHLFFSGLNEIGEWSSLDGRSKPPKGWFSTIAGNLETYLWNGGIFQDIRFPTKVEIDFHMASPYDRPSLEIGLLRKPEEGPRLETWEDVLVLTYQNRFAEIMPLTDAQHDLNFRLFWNQESGDLKVCSPSGKVLASLEKIIVPKDEYSKSGSRSIHQRGFSVVNRTSQLVFSQLSVRQWNGKEIPVVDVARPRVETIDGKTEFDLGQLALSPHSDTLSIGGKKIALDSVSGIVFAPRETNNASTPIFEVPDSKISRIGWHDGTIFRGELREMNEQTVAFQPEWCRKPLRANLRNVREIEFPGSASATESAQSRIVASGLSLRGVLRVGDNTDAPRSLLAWQPVGSENASPMADGKTTLRIEQINDLIQKRIPKRNEARVFLKNNEIIAGMLPSIKENTVHFVSEPTGPIKIPYGLIRAVDMENENLILTGFADKGWHFVSEPDVANAIGRNNEKVSIKTGAFGHPSIMMGDYIRFRCDWKGSYGAVTIRLFCSEGDPSSPSFDIVLAAQGNQMFVGGLKRGRGFNFSGERVAISGNGAEILIRTRPDKVELEVNGKPVFSKMIEKDQIAGNGLYFQLGGGWQGWNTRSNEVTISDFQVNQSPGFIPILRINPEAKENALTVPRSWKKHPFTHLLIAPNGDILRGNLTSLNGDFLQFVSRSTTIKLPRDRVAAIVWPEAMQKPISKEDRETPIDPFEDSMFENLRRLNHPVSHQIVLNDGSHLNLAADRVENDSLIGSSSILGTCRIPFSDIRELKAGPATPIFKLIRNEPAVYADWSLKYTPEPHIPGGKEGQGDQTPLTGKPAPDFSLTMLDGGQFKLSEYKGKVVILDFWATWCGPCIKAMPDVMAVARAFRENRNVVFCAVNQAETPPLISEFLEKRQWQGLPTALDFNMAVSSKYQVEGIPHTIVIGKSGKIAWTHSGYTKNLKNELAEAVARELDL